MTKTYDEDLEKYIEDCLKIRLEDKALKKVDEVINEIRENLRGDIAAIITSITQDLYFSYQNQELVIRLNIPKEAPTND